MKSNKVKTNIYFDPDLKLASEAYCARRGLSLTKFVEQCVFLILDMLSAADEHKGECMAKAKKKTVKKGGKKGC